MEQQMIEKSLKPTKEKCSQMSTNSQLLSNYSNLLKKQAFVGQSFVQIEQLRTLSNNAKEILLYHGILNDRHEVKDDQNDIVISNFLKNYDYGNLSQSHLAKLREIQYVWMELHKCIRFIYKNAIASTPCVVFNEKIPDAITNAIKQFAKRLCEEDCQQLFIRLEVLLKEFVLEARDQLNLHHNVNDLPRTYLKCLLASYGAFCVAADNLAPCIPQFNSLLMQRFSISLQLLNKYLFHTCLYADAFVQNNVPYYISQLKTLSPEAYFTNQELIHSFIAFDDEMADIASKWFDVKKMILEFSRERVLLNSKPSVLLEDWEVYKENRELATTKIWQFRSFKKDLAEFDVQLLSLLDDITNHISDLKLNPTSKKNGIKSCKNCIMKSFCLCEDCDNKHIVTYLDTPPASPILDINYTTSNSQILQKYNAMSKEKEEKSLILEKKINGIIVPKSLLKLIPDKLITKSPDKIIDVEELEEQPIVNIQTNILLPEIPVIDNAAILTTEIPAVTETTIVQKTATEKDKESPKQASLKQSNNVNTKKKIKSDLSCKNTEPQSTAKANKENKHCDCPHCEVFESTNGPSLSKNKTRDRLRLRLNEKQSKANKENITTKQTVEKVESKVEIKILEGKMKKVETKTGKVDVKPGKVETTKTGKVEMKTGKVETKIGKAETKPKVEMKTAKIEIKSDKTNKLKAHGQQKEKIEATNNVPDIDTRNIRDLINFIEGIDLNAQLINAQKKAAKKARRREKKLEEERLKQEELDRIATEKAREEERKLKERLMKSQPVHHNSKKGYKNHDKIAKHTKNHKHQTKSEKKPVVQSTPVTKHIVTEIKHVGPMVTIKRVMECTNSEPTVTITLKGSTPDKDKLLYTLVNGQTDLGKTVEEITSPKIESNSQNNNNNNNNKNNNININNSSNNNNSTNSKKKNKKTKRDQTKVIPPNVAATAEPINNNLIIAKKQKNNNTNNKNQPPPSQDKVVPHPKLKEQKKTLNHIPKSTNDTVTITAIPEVKKTTPELQSPTKTTAKPSESSLNLHMLRLPPGITITKVDGPTVPRKIQNPKPNPPVMSVQSSPLHKTENRSGVIVVDTVKLKENQPVEQSLSKTSKKKNKRKNKNMPPENNQITTKSSEKPVIAKHNLPLSYKLTDAVSASVDSDNQINGNSIVTIKNPLFYQLQESLSGKLNKPKKQAPPQPKEIPPKNLLMQQASIIRGANGMVTIRSPSLGTQTMQPCTDYTELIRPNQAPSIPEYKSEVIHSTSGFKAEKKKPFNAQEILGGLPGIEITKVNNRTRNKHESKVYQPADVSIIPTNIANGTNGDVYKLFSDNVDWSLESVFAPKDIKEDEVLDAEELELEAFKRFCQQSVPPKRKEKVAHLNVKDIVLKKKNC